MKKAMIMITVLVMLASVSKGMEPVLHYDRPMVATELQDLVRREGPFVEVPAEAGEFCFAMIGIGLIAPFELAYYGISYGHLMRLEHLSFTIGIALEGFGRTGAYLFGIPFYIVKKLLWDGPVYLYEAVAGKDED